MILRIHTAALVLIICGSFLLTSPVIALDGADDHGTPGMSTSSNRLFARSLESAEQGDLDRALELALQAKDTAPGDVKISFKFIDTISEITSSAGTKSVNKLLNEAIGVAAELKEQPICDGSQDPALGFGYMNSLSTLANAVRSKQESTASQLFMVEGEVANNLLSNPYLNPEATRYLGKPFYDTAVGYALDGNGELAVDSLNQAIEVGFTGFEKINDETAFNGLAEREQIQQIAVEGRAKYLAEVDAWASDSLASFQPFAFEFSADNVEGGKLEKSKRQGKITVVDLWATWCPPCLEGLPHFIQLNNEFSANGVQVIGLSVDNVEDPASALEVVRETLAEKTVDYPCGMADQQMVGQIPGETQWPTTLFIDADGTVRMVARGYHDYDQLSAIVNKLLAE